MSRDLAAQLKALLEGSQCREPTGPIPRRKPNPLYGGGGNQRRPPSQPRRSRSTPSSPTGVSKARASSRSRAGAGGSSKQRSARSGLPGGAASTGTSPVHKQALQQPLAPQPPTASLDFSLELRGQAAAARRLALSPSSTQQRQQQPNQPPPQHASASQQLLSFGQLCITSPNITPQSSPRTQQPAAASPASVDALSPAASLPRHQQQRQHLDLHPSPLSSPPTGQRSRAHGDENWYSVPPSPADAGGCISQDGPAKLPAATAPCSHSRQRGQQPSPGRCTLPAAESPAVLPASAPLPPFDSSQERRQEIALLSDMAADGAAAWSSQEEEQAAASQHQHKYLPLHELRSVSPAGPPSQQEQAQGPATGSARLLCSSQAAGSRVGSQQGQQPSACSLTSQELSVAAEPLSQKAGDGAEGQQQQQQAGGSGSQCGMDLDPHAPAPQHLQPDTRPQLQPAPPAATDVGHADPSSSYPAQRYGQQHGRGCADRINQWATLGSAAGLPAQQQQQQVPAAAPSSPATLERRQQQREQEDEMVAGTCPIPQLCGVRESFPTQREAFAAADRYNRHMPLAPQPPVTIMSKVPLQDLLPLPGSATRACTPSSSSDGQSGSSESSRRPESAQPASSDDRAKLPPRAAEPAGVEADAAPPDFLSRHLAKAQPAVSSAGYIVAAALKRQREAPAHDADEVQQQQQQAAASRAAREQYEAALQAHQAAVAQTRQQHQQQQQLEGRQQRHAEGHQGEPPAGDAGQQAAATGPSSSRGIQEAAAMPAEVDADLRQEAVRTFCVERQARSGTFYRSFTAASYPCVWQLFRRTPPEERHWYEVIREGRPAHLYFDLEFVPRLNPQVRGDKMVDALLVHVAAQLRLHFGLRLDPRCVYELDSSTPDKFSRHLTLRLPGHAFATNHAMGKFVAQVLAASGSELLVVRGEAEAGSEAQAPALWSMVDTAVYSKNRHWRMSHCCKGGKAAVLRPTARYATQPGAALSDACVFLDTLVCNVEPHARLLQMPDPLPSTWMAGRTCALSAAALRGGAGFSGGPGALRASWKQDSCDAAVPLHQAAELRRLAEAALPFVERAATQRAGGAPARARTLALCGEGTRVAYSMVGPGSHYCENVGRPHASNHVFFVLDFAAGIYAQKCHDPDCSRFRSAWMPLAPELCLLEAAGAAGATAGRGQMLRSPQALEASSSGRGSG
ncbi:hypothetical protein D9Q98_001842 [Chlorella vulgaris]|uniref:DNA-directed primase/polymerase protein n=1 Tax=Chlorella vulgaris TaxID=3077 RepID=A0A9D4TVC8_CHLVU|nr:hypothetical protein D9Q98_001842 [Chlorella vulgaris]